MTILVQDRLAPSGLPNLVPQYEARRSELLSLLPAMYASDDFMGRFLCIFEDTLKPLMQMADNLHYYFNPLTAPPELISWLATWVNLVLDESWSMEQRRKLIYSASDLYSRRGTRRGLIEYLKLYTGIEPEITEYVDGMVLGPETLLGINTTIAGRERHSFTVTIRLQGLSEEELASKEASIRRIIEAEKPAHTGYRLNLLTNGNGNHNASAENSPSTEGESTIQDSSIIDDKPGKAEPPQAIG
jgi:phage tail-like protein